MGRWNMPAIAAMALLVVSREAIAADSRMALRGGAGWMGPSGEWTGDLLMTEGINVTKLKADSATVPQLSLECRFTSLIGGEASVLQASQEVTEGVIDFSGSHEAKFGHLTEWPILFGANVHVIRNRNIDLYLGPVIGWVIWSYLKPSAAAQQDVTIGTIKMRDDFACGVNVGVDLPFAKHWVLNFDFRALDYSARTDSRPIRAVLGEDARIPIKPLIASAAFGLKW